MVNPKGHQTMSLRLRSNVLIFGRGSWIRTNDLQYPKLPRYQAALYPALSPGKPVDTRSRLRQQDSSLQGRTGTIWR